MSLGRQSFPLFSSLPFSSGQSDHWWFGWLYDSFILSILVAVAVFRVESERSPLNPRGDADEESTYAKGVVDQASFKREPLMDKSRAHDHAEETNRLEVPKYRDSCYYVSYLPIGS